MTVTTVIDLPYRCHASGCSTEVPPKRYMCREHWGLVPLHLREILLATYDPTRGTNPAEQLADFRTAASEAVAVVERREEQRRQRREKLAVL